MKTFALFALLHILIISCSQLCYGQDMQSPSSPITIQDELLDFTKDSNLTIVIPGIIAVPPINLMRASIAGARKNPKACNLALKEALYLLGFNDAGFLPNANSQYDYLKMYPNWFRELDLDENVQDMANSGYIILAAARADPHGHVVIVVPSWPSNIQLAKDYNSYSSDYPLVAGGSEGKVVAYGDKTANYVFVMSQNPPTYFVVQKKNDAKGKTLGEKLNRSIRIIK